MVSNKEFNETMRRLEKEKNEREYYIEALTLKNGKEIVVGYLNLDETLNEKIVLFTKKEANDFIKRNSENFAIGFKYVVKKIGDS